MNFTRRNFMKTGAAAVAGFTIAPSVVLGKTYGHVPPSDQINIAGIGFGNQGGGDLQNIADPDAPVKREGLGGMQWATNHTQVSVSSVSVELLIISFRWVMLAVSLFTMLISTHCAM